MSRVRGRTTPDLRVVPGRPRSPETERVPPAGDRKLAPELPRRALNHEMIRDRTRSLAAAPWRPAVLRFRAAQRVRLLVMGIAVAAVVGYLTIVRGLALPVVPFLLPWPVAAIAFYLGEVNVVQVQFLRERHAFSLSELPAVIGLFLLAPDDYLLALMIGTTAALLVDRHASGIKRAFNAAQFALNGVVALIVFHLIANPVALPGPQEWIAGLAAAAATSVVGAILVATVISASGGAPQFTKLPEMIRFSGMVALANASLALLAVMVLWIDVRSAFLLGVPIAVVFLAYRAYVSEREKHERLELLYESSRLLHYTPELDGAIVALVEHARRMFRAESVSLVLLPSSDSIAAVRSSSDGLGDTETMVPAQVALDDPIRRRITTGQGAFRAQPGAGWTAAPERTREAAIGPLVGERGVLGAILIVNRLGEGSRFTDDDLRLLETVANQAAIALENGRLEQSLHELSTLKEALRHQAYHDPLTGLANRLAFVEEVERRLGAMASPEIPTAIVFLDLDDFKIVNDTLGHGAGDELLAAVAERIGTELRGDDLLARFGGDEFAILPADDSDPKAIVAMAQRIIATMDLPFPVGGTDVVIGCSAGVSLARSGESVEGLLRDADVAMYRAKSEGKRRVSVFDPLMHRSIVDRHALTKDLALGVSRGDLTVHYQPIVALGSGRIVALEALARWIHVDRGEVDPAEFIRLAEENGSIHALGRAVLFEAAQQVVAWQRLPGLGALGLTVNLSPVQIQHPDFVEGITEVIVDSGISPADLTFEMTETGMFRDITATIEKLESLRSMGIRIAMDDFGTGYSSLAYLRRFPVDFLKIARELIADPLDPEPEAWEFARAIIAMGRSLGLPIVAEGIETEGQLAVLQRMGCGLGQGFLFARPAPATEIEGIMRDWGVRKLSA